MSVSMTFNGKVFEIPEDIDMSYNEGLAKIRLSRHGMVESVWVVIHPQDLYDYKSDKTDYEYKRVCILANQSLSGIPWGAYVPYKLTGNELPISIFEEIIDITEDEIYFPEKIKAQYDLMEQQKQEGKNE